MSRTTLYKGVYFAMLAAAGVIGLGFIAIFHFSWIAIIAVFIAMQIPGRILGYYWRDLLKGLRLLNAREFAESKLCSEKFLQEFPARRWIKNLVWLGSSTYSRNPEVLALNNLGAAELNLGEVASARTHLERAINLDPFCPLPYYNMAVLCQVEDDEAGAQQWFADASRLGFANKLSDKIVRSSQTRFANRSGR